MKYLLSVVLAFSLVASPIMAADTVAGPEPQPKVVSPAPLTPPKLTGACAILTDADTGQIIYQKNAFLKRPMASTTKIMTAILVIENCGLGDTVTASKNVTKTPFTSFNLRLGEKATVRTLLSAMLIRSANDASVALAEHVAGSVPAFAKMMNAKALELGAKNTRFVTPNGLYAPGHYSTAYDLALITRYAMKYPIFNEIVCTNTLRVERSINQKDLYLVRRSRFMKNYAGADGVKSGYIKQAGNCYVGSATRDGWRLVSVVLKSNDAQADTATMMDYGFKNFERVILAQPDEPIAKLPVPGGSTELEALPAKQLSVVVRRGQSADARAEHKIDDIHAPVRKGAKVGVLTAYVGNSAITSVDLRAANNIEETPISVAWPWMRSFGLLGMISIGVACGRAVAKSPGIGRSRFS